MEVEGARDSPDIRQFLEAIRQRYGYDLRGYAPGSMHRRVLAALARCGLSKVSDLERRTLEDPEVFTGVLEDLTVRVSSMFRDPGFFRTLRARVVPLLRTYPRLNIWVDRWNDTLILPRLVKVTIARTDAPVPWEVIVPLGRTPY